MAVDFPMSLRQLLPVLDVIGNANKHLARVAKFLSKYGDLALFSRQTPGAQHSTCCGQFKELKGKSYSA